MLQLFSKYLKRNYLSEQLSIDALRAYALAWFAEMLDWTWDKRKKFFNPLMMPLFRGGNENSPKTILYKKFQEWIIGITKDEFTEKLDICFFQLNNLLQRYAVAHFSENPLVMSSSFYPFSPFERNNGVQMICRLRLADGLIVNLSNNDFHVRSAIGSNNSERQAIKRFITDNINSCSWIKNAFKDMNIVTQLRDHIDMNEPHAEDIWFIKYGQNLIDTLQDNRFYNEGTSDFFPLSYLDGARIEFVLSSSPCGGCKLYFQVLRTALDSHNIQLPIVIFSNRHTNTDERDCSIFIVNKSGQYQQLPIQWSGELIRDRGLTRHLSPLISLTDTYKTVLTLQIFGDALLPRLVYLQPSMVSMFLLGLLESESTNHLMVDWVRYYFRRVLATLPFDFSPTIINKSLLDANNYSTVDYRFLTSCMTIPGVAEYAKKIILLTVNHPENVTGFFLLICKNYSEWTCQFLTGTNTESIDDLHLGSELKSIAQTVNNTTTWDIQTAPKEVLRTSAILKERPIYVYSDRVSDLSRSINATWEYIHFLSIEPIYQRNILNALFTHPSNSPLGENNASYTDEDITNLIEFTLKAIKLLALQNGRWNMQVVERIFNAFRDKFFDQELVEAINQLWKVDHSKHLPQLKRIFPIEQARLGHHMQIISFDSPSVSIDEKTTLDSANQIYLAHQHGKIMPASLPGITLQNIEEKRHSFSLSTTANKFFQRNLQALPPKVSFFRKLRDEYISEHRHDDPKIQREYDLRFGLMLRS